MRQPAGLVKSAIALCLLGAQPLAAQGTLSALGFGYPVGGTSTRAAATAGAFGEFDLMSPINPAVLGGLSRTFMTAQTEPEFRTLRFGAVQEKTTAQRVPLVMVAFPLPHDLGVAISASTYLDRSYSTVSRGDAVISGSTAPTTDRTDVRGAIGDLRAAVGWRINEKFSVGAAGHLFTGDHLVAISRVFDDTVKFGSVNDSSRVVYFGTALSVGGEWRVRKGLAAMASYRKGGGMNSRVADTVKTNANVPDRMGVGLRYDGIPGSTFALGVDKQTWSRLNALGSAAVQAHDGTNWHVGAETAGPKMRDVPVLLRAGFARNSLPFGVNSDVVNETRLSFGFGLPVAQDNGSIDFSLQRANRTLRGGAVKESAWMLGVGVQIRP